ncbi:MAG: hypothetical protein AB7U73_15225 [Pirellulales bacterium]
MTNRARPVWPYVCILIALFALSVMAPERWEEASRHARLSPSGETAIAGRGSSRPHLSASNDGVAALDERAFDYSELLNSPPRIEAPKGVVWSADGPEVCDWEATPAEPGLDDGATADAALQAVAKPRSPEPSSTALAWPGGGSLSSQDAPSESPDSPRPEIARRPETQIVLPSSEPDDPEGEFEADGQLDSRQVADEGETETTFDESEPDASDDATADTAPREPDMADSETKGADEAGPVEPAGDEIEPASEPRELESRPTKAREPAVNRAAARKPAVASDQPSTAGWTPPFDLLEQLESLQNESETREWATAALELLDQIAAVGGPRSIEGLGRLSPLRALATESSPLADRIAERFVSRRLRVAGHALARRLAIWNALSQADAALESNHEPVVASDRAERGDQLLSCLDDIEKLASTAPAGASWRKYMLVDQLHALAARRGACGDDEARQLARNVLRRLDPRLMTARQRQFIDREAVVALDKELRHWASEEVDLDRVQANLEEYELTARPSAGRQVLADARLLGYSPEPQARELAKTIEANYRVANLRMSISDDLLQKMMPKQDPRHQFIRQTIMGMEARGQTTTTSNVKIEFVPDDRRLRFVMQVTGLIHARATSEKGLIKVHSRADSDYVVLKNFEFTLDGLHAQPAMADAHTRARLRGIDTPLEPVPLLGSVLEGYVRDRYRNSKRAAERELRRKIMAKVIEQVEKETDTQIVDANDRLKKNLLDPLRSLDLEPKVAALQTTKDRMTIRLRLAGDDQLAANTPRPRAPTDSLASIQMHESALNNIIARLELDGREFSQAELHRWVATKLNRPLEQVDDNLRDDVFLKFAPRDAVRARALEGRVELTLALTELRAEGSRFRNFVVRVYYRPDEASTSGELERDGVVQLIGQRLGPKAQIALRGVFSKTFSKERRFRLLPPRFSKDEQLADIGITQMVIQDGWLGMGIGTVPREASKPIQLRR